LGIGGSDQSSALT
jgi:DNA-binding transcriptional regulator YdaS (Cro superfamily)